MSRLVELMAETLRDMPTPPNGFFTTGERIGKITVAPNPDTTQTKLTSWDEWKPPQEGTLRAVGRARLGVFPWCLMAICHKWDERQNWERMPPGCQVAEANRPALREPAFSDETVERLTDRYTEALLHGSSTFTVDGRVVAISRRASR